MMDVIHLARLAGLDLSVDGDDLVLEAAAPPPAEGLDLLRQHKRTVVALLTQTDYPDLARDVFEERAAIHEFDEGQDRAHAELEAAREAGLTILAAWRREADDPFNPDEWR